MSWKTVLLVICIIGSLALAAPVVSADEESSSEDEENDSDANTDESDATDSEEESSEINPEWTAHSQEIDDSTRITGVDWDYEGQVALRIESDRPQQVLITDSNSIKSTGHGDVTFARDTVSSGESVMVINAETDRSGSKTLTVSTSEDMGYLSNPRAPLIESVSYSDLFLAGFGSTLGPILVGAGYVIYRKRKIGKEWVPVLPNFKF